MPVIRANIAEVQAATYCGQGAYTEYRIDGCPGLLLAVYRPKQDGNHRKSWIVAYWMRRNGKRLSRKKSLGRFPAVTLRMAQRMALEMRDQIDQGIDVVAVDRENALQAVAAKWTFVDLANDYFEARRRDHLKSLSEVERTIRRDAYPVIGHLAPNSIRRQDIDACLQRFVDCGKLSMGRHLLKYLGAIFNYAMVVDPDLGEKYGIEANPTQLVARGIRGRPGKLGKSQARQRALDDHEIGAFLSSLQSSAHATSGEMRAILKLMLLTGQRTIEVRELTFDELHLKGDAPTWRLPSTRTKNGRAHEVPLVIETQRLLREQIGQRRSGLVFPSPKKPKLAVGISAPGRAVKRLFQSGHLKIDRFTPHDLRRTVETGMARLGVTKEVRDRVLNHADTSIGGTHYNRHDYAAEKREALERWTQHVLKLQA